MKLYDGVAVPRNFSDYTVSVVNDAMLKGVKLIKKVAQTRRLMQDKMIVSAPCVEDEDEEKLLRKMVDVIIREISPEAIILFGSRARGDARADSDVDLLVIEKEPFSPQRSRRKEAARLYMALRGLAISKDILLYSREEFDHWKNSLNHVVGRAHREGRVLHGRL